MQSEQAKRFVQELHHHHLAVAEIQLALRILAIELVDFVLRGHEDSILARVYPKLPRRGTVACQGVAGNHCDMNFRLLARWPSKDILPTSVACDTACEALRHYRRMRKNRMEVLIIVTWEGAGSREITTHRLRTLAESERAKIRRPKRRNWKTVTGALVGMVASTLPRAFSDIEIELAATTLATSLCCR